MQPVTLKFHNPDATPQDVTMMVDIHAVKDIVCWYASHHSGDNFTVHVDGVKQALDLNGELL